jgi:vanillate monooxygenase
MDGQGLTFRVRDGPAAVFAEDWVILEAQQRSLLGRPARKLLHLKIDAGGTHARRIITRELARIARTEAG